jgi:hypothetical protein
MERFEYPNLSALESDVKRMVANAKHFNEKGSSIYEDAERVRKTASNWMVKFNPAYRNPAYVAIATPIPGENDINGTALPVSAPTPPAAPVSRPSHPVRHSTSGAERSSRSSMAPARRKSESAAPSTAASVAASAAASASVAEHNVTGDYAGKTFQEAQEQLIQELIHHAE